jgi:hypothetical protein
MAERIFCNVENRAFDASEFEAGPGNVTIHRTVPPHTLDGWPVDQGEAGPVIKTPDISGIPEAESPEAQSPEAEPPEAE